MEKFIVSARKYRPQNFETVVGQSHITTTLKNAIKNNTLAHAFLFCGPRGVGKTTCARILAKTINCENLQPDGEACNTCHSCTSFDAGTSLNIHELDAASNNSVDDIRSLVEQVRFAPQAGTYKVYIVDEVHMLSTSAFNAFLKTLEEPPPYAKFILATTEKHKILPTILSRCQIFDFKRITNADAVEHLVEIAQKEAINTEKAALQLIAQKSEGCMRDSLSIFDKIVSFTNGTVTYQNTLEHLNILDEDYYFRLLDSLLKEDLSSALLLFDQINRKGFEGDTILNGMAEFVRNLMVSKDAKAAALLDVVEGMQQRYADVAQTVSLSYLISALNVLNDAEMQFKIARNKRLHVEICLIKLCYLQQAIELAAGQNGTVQKKKRVDGPVAYKTSPVPQIIMRPPGGARQPAAAKLEIETAPVSAPQMVQSQAPVHAPVNQAVAPPPVPAVPVAKASYQAPAAGGKKGLLQSLKDKHDAKAGMQQEQAAIRDLDYDELVKLWGEYIQRLKAQLKHSSVSSFELTRLHVASGTLLELVSPTFLNQKFIEQEKIDLLQMIQQHFNNKSIQFSFKIDESQQAEVKLEAKYLSSKERFNLLVRQFPLVQELKDRLRLDLDY